MMNLVWLFPGQSSRYAGMLHKLSGLTLTGLGSASGLGSGSASGLGSGLLTGLLDEASALLNRDLRKLDLSPEPFATNRDIQVSVFLANLMCQQALESHGLCANYSLGLSLGQYNHLVHIGALSWQEALILVDARGQAYDRGPAGAMASIQPVSLEGLQELLGERLGTPGSHGDLEIVNRNSPRQQVIAGEQEAVYAACSYLEDEHYLAPIVIERKIPMHASRFAPVAQDFAPALDAAPFQPPCKPYLCNRDATFRPSPSVEDFKESLSGHLHSPVRWQESVETVVAQVQNPVMVEVGAMGVLFGLLHRRWLSVKKYKCDVKEGVQAHFAALVTELLQLQDQAQASSSMTPATTRSFVSQGAAGV